MKLLKALLPVSLLVFAACAKAPEPAPVTTAAAARAVTPPPAAPPSLRRLEPAAAKPAAARPRNQSSRKWRRSRPRAALAGTGGGVN